MTAREELEPIGHLKFGMARSAPIMCETTLAEWLKVAEEEHAISRQIVSILNANDEKLEAKIRDAADPAETMEAMLSLCESCIAIKQRYEAGIDCLEAASARILVVLERIHGGIDCENTFTERRVPS